MDIEEIFERLFNHFNVSTMKELSKVINTSQQNISKWKTRNAISAIKKKCRELGIYKDIFERNTIDTNSKINLNSKDEINKSDLSKYFISLESVAIATNKEDELLTDIRELIKKYIQ